MSRKRALVQWLAGVAIVFTAFAAQAQVPPGAAPSAAPELPEAPPEAAPAEVLAAPEDLLLPPVPATAAPTTAAPTTTAAPAASSWRRPRPPVKTPAGRRATQLRAPLAIDPAPAPPTVEDTIDADDIMRSARGVGIASAHVFIWPYLTSLLVAGVAMDCDDECTATQKELPWLAVPVLGPFISYGVLGSRANDTARGILIADGVFQTVGVAGFVISAVVFHNAKSIARRGEVHGPLASAAPSVQVAPLVLPGGGGVGLTGSF